jgi:predicted transcriptional regulator
MTREVVSLAGDASLDMAAWRFASEAISGAPVRDARGTLIGVLSKSDLVDRMREPGDAGRVQDAMTPAVWAVHPDAPAIEAVALMVEKSIHRVLVVRGPAMLEGIVTTMDVLRALSSGGDFHAGDEAGDGQDEEASRTRAGAGR